MTGQQSGGPSSGDAHTPETSDPFQAPGLHGCSSEALDALVEAGWNIDAVAPHLRPAALRAMDLLTQLDPRGAAPSTSSSLTSRTMDLIFAEESPGGLSRQDALAADAWVESGFQLQAVPEDLQARASAHAAISRIVSTPVRNAPRRGELAARTARLIDLVSVDSDDELAPIPISRGAWFRQRAWDVVTAAAMLLVAASIMWPVLAGMRQRNIELQCSSNLQSVASALSAYAGENKDSLPIAVASFGPQKWWDVNADKPVANSSNLFTLVKSGYTHLASLACPGNPRAPHTSPDPSASDWRSLEEISYSYQLMYGRPSSHWSQDNRRVILADRSPAVLRAVRGQMPDPRENSPNHHGAGQHGLFTDGSADWLDSPFIKSPSGETDCIWLPRPPRMYVEGKLEQHDGEFVLTLTGRELPADGSDVFLGP